MEPGIPSGGARPGAARDAPNRWMLVPRAIPLMEETPERLLRLREAEGVEVPEVGERVARSDCHAWSASPNFELFRTVLGIDSAAPGFRRARIRPHLGRLARASGAIPHPRGEIAVDLARAGETLKVEVTLPQGIEGELVWRGKTHPLASGTTMFTL